MRTIKKIASGILGCILGCIIFYYVIPMFNAISKLGTTKYFQLVDDIKAAPYQTNTYEEDVFDCSDMTHILYDYLKEKGWDVNVCVWYKNDKPKHVSLILDDVDVYIESTKKRIMNPVCYWWLPRMKLFQSFVEANVH